MNERFLKNTVYNELRFDVDESMIPYFGRHPTKQSMRNKPVRFGFKMYCLNQPSGYLIYCDPYQGKGSGHHEFSGFGLSGGTVLYLVNKLLVKGIIYMDNFFSSIKLFNELTKMGFGAVGTFRNRRINDLPSHLLHNAPRGTFNCFTKENEAGHSVMVTEVVDNSIVIIGSNVIQSQPLEELQRFSKVERKKVTIRFPSILLDYNSFMGGTDKMDQFISGYRVSIRRKKFYMSLFNWLISVTIYNSWILYKKSDQNEFDFLQFSRQIAAKCLAHSNRPKRGRPSSISTNEMHLVIVIPDRKTLKCTWCHKNTRYKCMTCDCPLHPDQCFYHGHKYNR